MGARSRAPTTKNGSDGDRLDSRPGLLVCRNHALVPQCESDVVEPLHEAPTTEIVDGEGPNGVVHSHLAGAEIDGDLLVRLALGHLPQGLDGLEFELNREQTFLERIATEDVAEPRRDDDLEAPIAQRPDGVLTR